MVEKILQIAAGMSIILSAIIAILITWLFVAITKWLDGE